MASRVIPFPNQPCTLPASLVVPVVLMATTRGAATPTLRFRVDLETELHWFFILESALPAAVQKVSHV